MKAYPSTYFRLETGEQTRIEALGAAILKTAESLSKSMIFSLTQCERGNATMAAFETWCGRDGHAIRARRELTSLLTEIDAAFAKPRERARRILRQRIRRQPKRKLA